MQPPARPMGQPIRMGIVGVGKIARDQHIPCIAADPGFKLLAVASRNNAVEGVASYPSLEQMLAGAPELDAVAISLLRRPITRRPKCFSPRGATC